MPGEIERQMMRTQRRRVEELAPKMREVELALALKHYGLEREELDQDHGLKILPSVKCLGNYNDPATRQRNIARYRGAEDVSCNTTTKRTMMGMAYTAVLAGVSFSRVLGWVYRRHMEIEAEKALGMKVPLEYEKIRPLVYADPK